MAKCEERCESKDYQIKKIVRNVIMMAMVDNYSVKTIDSINRDEWNQFVYNNPHGNIFQTSDMAEVYRRTKNYEPISLAAIDNTTNEIFAVLLAVVIKEVGGIFGSFSAHSRIHDGPLFLEDENGKEAAKVLMQYYDKIAQKKALYSEIRMLSNILFLDTILLQDGYFFEDHLNAIIDLNKSKEELWNELKRDRKRGIKKARNLNVVIEECTQKDGISICYNLILETYKTAKIPLADISLFESIFDILVPIHKAIFLFAKYENKYIATQVALLYGDIIYAWYTGVNRKFLSHHPGDLLIWHLLEWGSENGYKKFDFGGGGTPTKNINLREYKSRFGCEFFNYGRYKKEHSAIKLKIAETGFKVCRRIFR